MIAALIVVIVMGSSGDGSHAKPVSFRDCSDCPEMIVIPPGRFLMGSLDEIYSVIGKYVGLPSFGREKPQKKISLDNGFAIGKFEVKRSEYSRFVSLTSYKTESACDIFKDNTIKLDLRANWNNPGFNQTSNDPVVCITRADMLAYIAWLSKATGYKYRLLYEAEWEYVARAGSSTIWPWSDSYSGKDFCKFANVSDVGSWPEGEGAPCNDGFLFTAPAGSFLKNAFGVHDMIGNAMEMVQDCSTPNLKDSPSNGIPKTTECSVYSVRGGSFVHHPTYSRSAMRQPEYPFSKTLYLGFRIARDVVLGSQ